MRIFLLCFFINISQAFKIFNNVCVSYTSDFYQKNCNPYENGVLRKGCEKNKITIINGIKRKWQSLYYSCSNYYGFS